MVKFAVAASHMAPGLDTPLTSHLAPTIPRVAGTVSKVLLKVSPTEKPAVGKIKLIPVHGY